MVRADDKPNPSGTWKWTIEFGGQTREATLKLKLEGDNLKGAVIGRNGRETPIEDANCKNGNISFKVVRERMGEKFVTKYSGKVSGDTIKGKMEFEREGQTQSIDWNAKRDKE
jgi:hypothetical protein